MMEIGSLLKELNASKGKSDLEPIEEATVFGEQDINALKSKAELESLIINNKIRSEELESKKQDREQRKIYAFVAFGFLLLYMLCVFVILFFNGFHYKGFDLENSVLIALITTTTANVIGIFAFVMMYLFNVKHEYKQKKIKG